MKKILSFVVMALAMSLAFTSCASKKANEKGPTTYRVDLGSAADVIEVGNKKQLINLFIFSCILKIFSLNYEGLR